MKPLWTKYLNLSSSDGKESACNAGLIPGWGRSPGDRNGSPTLVFLPGKSHGQRSLVGYSPWGCKELAMLDMSSSAYSTHGTWWDVVCVLSSAQCFATVGFSWREHWSGLPFLLAWDLSTQRFNLCLLCLLHWHVDSLPLSNLGRC